MEDKNKNDRTKKRKEKKKKQVEYEYTKIFPLHDWDRFKNVYVIVLHLTTLSNILVEKVSYFPITQIKFC